jgi:hypothetical protein
MDRPNDGQSDRRTNRLTNGGTNRLMDGGTNRLTDGGTNRLINDHGIFIIAARDLKKVRERNMIVLGKTTMSRPDGPLREGII